MIEVILENDNSIFSQIIPFKFQPLDFINKSLALFPNENGS